MITELLVDNVMEFILIQYVAIEKIVVVDDELMIRKALETQLRNKRYSVASTGDLKGARRTVSYTHLTLPTICSV